jgi:hypothetical protein
MHVPCKEIKFFQDLQAFKISKKSLMKNSENYFIVQKKTFFGVIPRFVFLLSLSQ